MELALDEKLEGQGYTVRWKLHDPSFNLFEIFRKSPILPPVTLKPGSGVTQGHWFWYQ